MAGNATSLQSQLGLCTEPSSPTDKANLINLLQIPFNSAAEFQYPYANPGRTPIANPLDRIIQTVLATKDHPIQLLKSTTLLWFQGLNPSLSCLDFDTTLYQAIPLIQTVPFNYIVCMLFLMKTLYHTMYLVDHRLLVDTR